MFISSEITAKLADICTSFKITDRFAKQTKKPSRKPILRAGMKHIKYRKLCQRVIDHLTFP